MRTITIRAFLAFAITIITGCLASAAEQVDWQAIDAEWSAAVTTKTNSIAHIQKNYVDGLCQDTKKAESVKKKCVAEFKEIMARRAKERTLFEKMIEANKLPPAERDKRGNELFVEHTKMNKETTRMFNAAAETYK